MLKLKPAGSGDLQKEWRFVHALPADENGYLNDWHGISWEEYEQTALPQLLASSRGEGLPEGYVPETFFFLWEEEEIVGQFRFRHHLTEALREGAGHIGYTIAPAHRGKGYATKGLRLMLDHAASRVPEEEIHLRCERDNAASLRVMLKCGGRLHHQDEEKNYVRIPLDGRSQSSH
ncbi:MAG: GNAT family N-acetyltransferase [Clostridia bacterium]|nr:GNAT family N-acetyltransferase [Clostridia bacterium]MBQ3077522.1 GNAT family N-acetyltransferase [Clostridia bacterium]